MFGPILGFDPF